jgi:hypothetical protein
VREGARGLGRCRLVEMLQSLETVAGVRHTGSMASSDPAVTTWRYDATRRQSPLVVERYCGKPWRRWTHGYREESIQSTAAAIVAARLGEWRREPDAGPTGPTSSPR